MKKEEHFLDINIENKVFKRLFCNLSVLTLVLKSVIRKHSFSLFPDVTQAVRWAFSHKV